jgi:hypothetical protein
MYELRCIFRSGHDLRRYFKTEAEAEAARIGLRENPDIVYVHITRVPVDWTGGPMRMRIPGLM